MGDLYRFASTGYDGASAAAARPDVKARLDVAAKMREAALKSSIFVGVPRVGVPELTRLWFANVDDPWMFGCL